MYNSSGVNGVGGSSRFVETIDKRRMIIFSRAVTTCCFVWILSFFLFGGSRKGKDWYLNLAELSIINTTEQNSGDGVPMLMFGLPLLLSATVCSICVYRGSFFDPTNAVVVRRCSRWNLPKFLPLWVHRLYHRCVIGDGDFAFDIYALVFILVPCVVYTLSSIYRHLDGNDEWCLTEATRQVGNSFGMMSTIALPVFLVPVAKQGPILKIFGWSPTRAVRLHIWCGRIIVIGSIIHGMLHALRWNMLGERLLAMTFPPKQCWMIGSSFALDRTFEPHCSNETTECSCYDHFRNLTGIVAVSSLVIIGLTSLNSVRRHFYCLFYTCHIFAAPIILIAIVMHYNRAILYIAPSFLYYIASSFPTAMRNRNNGRATSISSVERIAGPIDKNGIERRPCVALTFEASDAAMQCFQPGVFAKLSVPELSTVSHPFTVNTVPGKANQIRIIFQEMGMFTGNLASKLTFAKSAPKMYLDGYHGSTDRLAQLLSHDVAVIVAGGIGVTPYLSLLTELVETLSKEETTPALRSRNIVFHWVCRNPNLVDYISKEYFQPIVNSSFYVPGLQIDIHIHHTGRPRFATTYSGLPLSNYGTKTVIDAGDYKKEGEDTASFAPSLVRCEPRSGNSRNDGSIFAFATISWVGLIVTWLLYSSVQQESQMWQRLLAPFAILALAALATLAFNKRASIVNTLSASDSTDGKEKRISVKAKRFRYIELESSDSLDTVETSSSSSDSEDLEMGNVTIKESNGRPTVQEILKAVDAASSPGVFSCGPSGLTREIRVTCEERSIARSVESTKQEACIPLYNEAFTM